MKNPESIDNNPFSETYIDQYCRSVEFLLNRINDKSAVKSARRAAIEEEFEYNAGFDHDFFDDY